MFIKKHLSGLHVAYPEDCGNQSGKLIHGLSTGRVQGSHYSGQRKRIADAVAYLQLIGRPECRPLIFVATSPGYVDRADEPRFVSKLVKNLKNGYRMENFVWVREYTGPGYPHFHFVAMIPLKRKTYTINRQVVPFDPVKLSLSWSNLFGCDNKNSIRVGSKPNKHGNRMIYLSNSRRKAWYLSKYIGKSRSQDEIRTRACIHTFGIDQVTSRAIEPQLFKSRYPTETKAWAVWNAQKKCFENQYRDIPTGERIFEDKDGNLFTSNVDWQRCGDHEVYTGFEN